MTNFERMKEMSIDEDESSKMKYVCEKDRCKWAVLDETGKKGICSIRNCPYRKQKSEVSYEIKWSGYYYKKCGKPKNPTAAGTPKTHWTTSRVEKLKRLYNDGEGYESIIKKVGMSSSAVTKKIAELKEKGELAGRKKVYKKTFWQPDKVKKLKEMYADGKSYKEIADALGTNSACVNRKIGYMRKTRRL